MRQIRKLFAAISGVKAAQQAVAGCQIQHLAPLLAALAVLQIVQTGQTQRRRADMHQIAVRRRRQATRAAPQKTAGPANLVGALTQQIVKPRWSLAVAVRIKRAALLRIKTVPGQRHQAALRIERMDGTCRHRATDLPYRLAGHHAAVSAQAESVARHAHGAIGQVDLRLEPVGLFRAAGQRHQ